MTTSSPSPEAAALAHAIERAGRIAAGARTSGAPDVRISGREQATAGARREAIGLSTLDTIVTAQALLDLHRVAEIAADLLAADMEVLAWSNAALTLETIPLSDAADDARAKALATLTGHLAALGYLTIQEETDDGRENQG